MLVHCGCVATGICLQSFEVICATVFWVLTPCIDVGYQHFRRL